MMLLPWLLTAEAIALAASIIGLMITLVSGNDRYALVPLLIAVILNSWHRRFGDQRNRRGAIEALRRHRQEVSEELEQLRQTLQKPGESSRPGKGSMVSLSPSPDVEETIAQLRLQNQRLEHSLRQVVQALNRVVPEPVSLTPAIVSRSAATISSPTTSAPTASVPTTVGLKTPSVPQWQRGIRFTAHEGWVNALDISPDGRILVTGGNDQKIGFWDLDTGELQQTCVTPCPVSALAFSPSGQILASGGYDHRIQLWRWSDSHSPYRFQDQTLEGHEGSVQTLLFVAEPELQSRCLVSGSYDQRIRIWDLSPDRSGASSIVLAGHQGSVQCLALDSDRSCLFSGGEDGQILQWSFPQGEAIGSLGHTTSALDCLILSPDNQYLIAGCSDGTLRIWNLVTLTQCYVLEAHTGPVTALTITIDGNTILSGGADGRLKLWHLPTGEAWGNLAEPVDAILDLRYCPHRQNLMSTHPGGQVQIWTP